MMVPLSPSHSAGLLGSLGRLVIFLWAVALVVLTPLTGTFIPAGIGLVVLGLLHPQSLRRIFQLRWLILLALLFLVNMFFGGGQADARFLGMPLSTANLLSGLQMTLCAVLILVAADGLAASVDITEVAGLLERMGLRGLGFSIGVATNLLPNLRQSSTDAWHSLRMRGGLRARWLRGLQYLLITILANALRHSEEIVLAAEARAFTPEKSRMAPIKIGRLDRWLIPVGVLSLAGLALLL
jgi:energy-coupling factor transporter transmembrane protein EcfT